MSATVKARTVDSVIKGDSTPSQAAASLGVSIQTVTRWVEEFRKEMEVGPTEIVPEGSTLEVQKFRYVQALANMTVKFGELLGAVADRIIDDQGRGKAINQEDLQFVQQFSNSLVRLTETVSGRTRE